MRTWTQTQLLKEAERLDYEFFTHRQVAEWVRVGLLPKRPTLGTGRGSKQGAWTEPQIEVFFKICEQKDQHHPNVATLANIPVIYWLDRGDDYVTIDQFRRAIRTWAGKYSTAPKRAIAETIREHIAVLPNGKRPHAAICEMLEYLLLELSSNPQHVLSDVDRGRTIETVRKFGYTPDHAEQLADNFASRIYGMAPFHSNTTHPASATKPATNKETPNDEIIYSDDDLRGARGRYRAISLNQGTSLAEYGSLAIRNFLQLLGKLRYNEENNL